jgi:putative membrane protein
MPEAIWTPYCGAAPAPAEILLRWNFDPPLLVIFGLAGFLIWSRSRGRSRWAGLAGLGVLAVVFISPLCALSSALFTARTVHHVLLVAAAAPLLAFALPLASRGGLAVAVLLQAVVFWAWHAPGAYGAALARDGLYWMMQASLLASAVWFWRAVRRATPPAATAALLAAMVSMGLLGAILTFAQQPFYEPHLTSTPAWGLTPLEDQQGAGLIMWAPAAAIYLLAALMAAHRSLKSPAVAARAA